MPGTKTKIKMTWTELKRQRSSLERYELYLPTLRLKQQQLQLAVLQTRFERDEMRKAAEAWMERISIYRAIFHDPAGVNLAVLSEPEDVKTETANVAGVKVPVFASANFPEAVYSLFGTPPWVDRALADQREQNITRVKLRILNEKLDLLQAELKKIMQRVNLFEKVMIPEARANIRRIRIALGDRMTAAVARAKMAKEKLQQKTHITEAGSG